MTKEKDPIKWFDDERYLLFASGDLTDEDKVVFVEGEKDKNFITDHWGYDSEKKVKIIPLHGRKNVIKMLNLKNNWSKNHIFLIDRDNGEDINYNNPPVYITQGYSIENSIFCGEKLFLTYHNLKESDFNMDSLKIFYNICTSINDNKVETKKNNLKGKDHLDILENWDDAYKGRDYNENPSFEECLNYSNGKILISHLKKFLKNPKSLPKFDKKRLHIYFGKEKILNKIKNQLEI